MKTHQTSKKKKKVKKKRKRSSTDDLSNVCNITGLDDGGILGSRGDNEMDCLDLMATAQEVDGTAKKDTPTTNHKAVESDVHSSSSPPPPPGIDRIPNLRIELARHLQTQTLSTFLLKSYPKQLRMPTFERWLLDSKLEESDRYQSIIQDWVNDPSSKLAYISEDKEKKKYGRAAYYEQKQKDKNVINAQYEREKSRYNKDCKLLIETEKQLPSNQSINIHDIESLDPILPHQVLDTDPSSQRLLKEIVAATSSTNNKDDTDEEVSHEQHVQKATEVVRELCHRTSEACKEIKHMKQRLGIYQKFADGTSIRSGGSSKKKKRKKGSSDNMDKVRIEWHNEDQLCSLIYVPKKRKVSRPSSQTGGFRNVRSDETTSTDKQDEDTTSHTQPKPFVVKINATHYHKLRAMFDKAYKSSPVSKDQATHAYHAILFAMVIRYSSLSGGQQLNDFRGGGMQGAIHEGVFDVLSKWFGKSGTECFASPFNSSMSTFFSAFPSPDIDGHFGSHGDFFFPSSSFDIQDGSWYELNPPFSPGVMDKMSIRISELLEIQSKKEVDVTFVVIIPTVRSADEKKSKKKHKKKKHKQANDKEGDESSNNTHLMSTVNNAASVSFNRLVNSPHCKSHIFLPPREHGYIEGSQHLRPTKYKESQYSTSVIVLKSKSWTSTQAQEFETEIREAFGGRHSMEVQQRKATKVIV